MEIKIAYMMSRFPKLTETFILYEMIELEHLGAQIEVFPLLRQHDPINHPEVAEYLTKTHFSKLKDLTVWQSQLIWLFQNPLVYLLTWLTVLWGNKGSLKFFLRAIPATLIGAHFAREMQALDIQHIHAHWATHATLSAFVIHRLSGIPYSFTGHAHDIYVETTMLAQKIEEAAFVVTISDYNRDLLTTRYGPVLGSKINVVRCGVDTAVFTPVQAAANHRNPTAPLRLIVIGQLEEKKGHRYLIEACKLLADRDVNFTCTLIGSGPLHTTLQTQISDSDLDDRVTLAGYKTRNEVQQLLTAADVIVMPSIRLLNGKQEGIPVALMEGLAMQKAAIATDISGISELIIDGETGLLVPERSAEALAEAIQNLAVNPELCAQLGQSGRGYVEHHFDLRQNAQKLYTLIEQTQAGAKAQPQGQLSL